MSSSEDSETAEWEREQMLRGSQSRGRQQQQTSTRQRATPGTNPTQSGQQNSSVIDASHAKRHVKSDIDRVEGDIEIVKRNIGSTRVDIVRVEKRIEAMKKYIAVLEQANPFFEQLARLKDPKEVIQCVEKHRSLIAQLPRDQREMIDLLEGNMKEAQVSPMEVDK